MRDILDFFFLKEKTAYEIEYGLVGSEMCIRERNEGTPAEEQSEEKNDPVKAGGKAEGGKKEQKTPCLLYTSDAADERSSVDLGGRRIIKKKNGVQNVGAVDA